MARRRNAAYAGEGTVLPRLVGRVVRPRHGVAGLSREPGRAQSTVALGRRRRPVPRSLPGNHAHAGRGVAAAGPFVLRRRTADARRLQRALLRTGWIGGRRRRAGTAARHWRPAYNARWSKPSFAW